MKKFITFFAVIFTAALMFFTIPLTSGFRVVHASGTDEIYTYSSTYVRDVTSLMKDNWSDNYYSQITMRVGDKFMRIDNNEVETDSAFVEDGELFLPLVDIAQNIGAHVIIDEQTGDTEIVHDKKKSRLQGERFRNGLKRGQHFSSKQAQEVLNIDVRKDGGNLTITNDFQTRQLIVRMKNRNKLGDNFGATQFVSDGKGAYLLQYDTEHLTKQAYNRLSQNKDIKWVEPNKVVSLPNTEKTGELGTTALTDRWGSIRINADLMKNDLIANGKTSTNIIVAVIDTGIDHNHTFLAGRVDTSLGYNFIGDNTNAYDDHAHGTHVAGTIVDCTTNNVKLIPVKVLNDRGSGSDLQVSLGVRHAADKGAKIMNMSLGGAGTSQEMKSAIDYAVDKNVTVVVAAGNDAKDTAHYVPASYDNVITVSAIDETDSLAKFSNFGDSVDIAAPGVRIQSSVPGGSYATYNGTSMAAPHIAAGVASLALIHPAFTPAQLKTAIQNTTIDLGSSRAFGAGVLDFRIFLGISEIPATGLQIYKVTGSTREIVNSIELMLLGDTILGSSLAVQVTPANATNKTVTATSSNSSIAEFIDGRVVAYASGTITLTFRTHNNITSNCTVAISFVNTWLAHRAAGYAGGTGTSSDPYQIANAEQLAKMAFDLNNPEFDWLGNPIVNSKYKLIADIDLAGKNWFPITTPFILYDRVVLDGDYHVIKNLFMSAAFTETLTGIGGQYWGMRNFGLFGLAENVTIKNLGMESANIYAPTVAPEINPLAVGIIAGRIERNTIIENCYVTGNVYSNVRGYYGGIVGYSSFGTPVISNSFARVGGNVQGGIVGRIDGNGTNATTITNCYATGTFSGPLSFNTGSQVNGAGGLIGEISGPSAAPMIRNCFTSAQVSGQGHSIVGAFIGRGFGPLRMANNYHDSWPVLPSIGAKATFTYDDSIAEPQSSFKTTSFFTTAGNWHSSHEWDFDDIWAIDSTNNGFPHLRGFYLTHAQTPTITSQPISVEALVGSNATFSVAANVSDGGTLSYQWYYTGYNTSTPVGECLSTQATLSIRVEGYVQSFIVIVTNTKNSATGRKTAQTKSNVVTIITTFPQPPTITELTTSKSVSIGETVLLGVSATSDFGDLTYQWYKNTANNTWDGTIIDGATNSTYTAPTGVAGTIYYYVIVYSSEFHENYSKPQTISNTIAVVVMTQLSPPTVESRISSKTISWDAVPDATGYHIYVNGTRKTTEPITGTSFDLSSLNLPVGSYNIQICAVGEGFDDSALSTAITFEVEKDSSWFKDNIIPIGIGAGVVFLLAIILFVVVRKKRA